MPLTFSIVTCSYQQGKYLDATIRSVLDQAYPALEYIVMDGGSTDASMEVIRRHAPALSYWVSEKDKGQTDALAKGFARSNGELMGWLCSDDLLLPNALTQVSAYFEAHPQMDAVYGDALWIDAQGQFIRPKKEGPFHRFSFLFDHNHIPQPSMFWRRRAYEAVGGLDTRFNLAMDSDLWERLSRTGRIGHMPAYLSCMRYYAEQKTRALRPQGQLEDAQIRSRSSLPQGAWLRPVLRSAARMQRVGAKLAAGGYTAKVDAQTLQALDSYRIPA